MASGGLRPPSSYASNQCRVFPKLFTSTCTAGHVADSSGRIGGVRSTSPRTAFFHPHTGSLMALQDASGPNPAEVTL